MGQQASTALSKCFPKKRTYELPQDQSLVTYPTQNWIIKNSELAQFNENSDDETITFQEILVALAKWLKNKETTNIIELEDIILHITKEDPRQKQEVFDQIVNKADEEEDGTIDCEELLCIISQLVKLEEDVDIEIQKEKRLINKRVNNKKWDIWAEKWNNFNPSEKNLETKTFISQLLSDIYFVDISDMEICNIIDSLEIDQDTGRLDFDELSLYIKNYFSNEMP